MANPNNKRYMSVKDIKNLDLGKELNKSLAERQALLGKMAGTASNIGHRMENAGASSLAKSMLERSLKASAGKITFAVPKNRTSQLVGKEKAHRDDGTMYIKYKYSGRSLNALVNERLQTMYKFITSSGSTITGAKQELKDAQERFHNESITEDDLKRIGDLYEEKRSEIERITNGSEIYQTLIGYGVASGDDYDTALEKLKKDLEKHGRPSKIDEEAEVEVDW